MTPVRVGCRRGVGLLEVVIALTMSTVLLYVMVQWLVATVALSQASSENSAVVRDSVRVLEFFEQDIASAQSCAGDLGLPFNELTSSSVDVFRDVNGDGMLDLVSWSFTGGEALRAVTIGDGGCVFDLQSRVWMVLSDVVAPYGPSQPALTPLGAGLTVPIPVDCADPGDCAFDGLRLDLQLVSPDGSVKVGAQTTATFTPYWVGR